MAVHTTIPTLHWTWSIVHSIFKIQNVSGTAFVSVTKCTGEKGLNNLGLLGGASKDQDHFHLRDIPEWDLHQNLMTEMCPVSETMAF
jgi:hypothetical protein